MASATPTESTQTQQESDTETTTKGLKTRNVAFDKESKQQSKPRDDIEKVHRSISFHASLVSIKKFSKYDAASAINESITSIDDLSPVDKIVDDQDLPLAQVLHHKATMREKCHFKNSD